MKMLDPKLFEVVSEAYYAAGIELTFDASNCNKPVWVVMVENSFNDDNVELIDVHDVSILVTSNKVDACLMHLPDGNTVLVLPEGVVSNALNEVITDNLRGGVIFAPAFAI